MRSSFNFTARSILPARVASRILGSSAARNFFRSAQAHNSVVLDDAEPLALTSELFHLPGRDEAWPVVELAGDAWAFTRSLPGSFEHRRTVRLAEDGLIIRDELGARGRHEAKWRFHLHPDWSATVREGGFDLVSTGGGKLRLSTVVEGASLRLAVVPGRFSAAYGRECPIRVCEARVSGSMPLVEEWRLRSSR